MDTKREAAIRVMAVQLIEKDRKDVLERMLIRMVETGLVSGDEATGLATDFQLGKDVPDLIQKAAPLVTPDTRPAIEIALSLMAAEGKLDKATEVLADAKARGMTDAEIEVLAEKTGVNLDADIRPAKAPAK